MQKGAGVIQGGIGVQQGSLTTVLPGHRVHGAAAALRAHAAAVLRGRCAQRGAVRGRRAALVVGRWS